MDNCLIQKSLFLLLILCFAGNLYSQRRKKRDNIFSAGVVVGLNLSQIDGDHHRGYNKNGIQGGLRATAKLSDGIDLSFELLYNKVGAKPNQRSSTGRNGMGGKDVWFDLDYMEVPFLIQFKTRENDSGHRTIHVHTGVSFARQMGAKVTEQISTSEEDINFTSFKEEFNKNELRWLVGSTFYFSKKFGITIRHSFSLSNLYTSKDIERDGLKHLKVYFLSLQAVYNF